MYSWMHRDVEMRDGGTSGKGIFAIRHIPKGSLLVAFGGYVMTLQQEQGLPDEIGDHAHQIEDNLVIGVSRVEDKQSVDQINHSCEPNAGFKGQIFLESMRDISPDEEITFDYAMTLAEGGAMEPYKMTCLCGRKTCRGVITDSDWRILELQQRYEGYFQYYIQKKIDALKTQPI